MDTDNEKLLHSAGLIPLAATRVFCEVVEQNSFTLAAQRLNVTPSAVSQRIRLLEKHVGHNLFVRHRRDVKLTEKGEFLYRQCSQALSIIEQAIISLTHRPKDQQIIFGVLASLVSKWLIPRISRFYEKYPEWQVVVHSVNYTIDVKQENFELAMINLPDAPLSPDLCWQLLWQENLFAVCSPNYLKKNKAPLETPADLRHHVLLHDQTEIASNRSLDWDSWMQSVCPGENISAYDGNIFTQSDLTLQAAIEGQGIALARSSLAANDIKKQLLIDPLGVRVPAKSKCYLCARKTLWDTPKIVALRQWLLNEVANDDALLHSQSTSYHA